MAAYALEHDRNLPSEIGALHQTVKADTFVREVGEVQYPDSADERAEWVNQNSDFRIVARRKGQRHRIDGEGDIWLYEAIGNDTPDGIWVFDGEKISAEFLPLDRARELLRSLGEPDSTIAGVRTAAPPPNEIRGRDLELTVAKVRHNSDLGMTTIYFDVENTTDIFIGNLLGNFEMYKGKEILGTHILALQNVRPRTKRVAEVVLTDNSGYGWSEVSEVRIELTLAMGKDGDNLTSKLTVGVAPIDRK